MRDESSPVHVEMRAHRSASFVTYLARQRKNATLLFLGQPQHDCRERAFITNSSSQTNAEQNAYLAGVVLGCILRNTQRSDAQYAQCLQTRNAAPAGCSSRSSSVRCPTRLPGAQPRGAAANRWHAACYTSTYTSPNPRQGFSTHQAPVLRSELWPPLPYSTSSNIGNSQSGAPQRMHAYVLLIVSTRLKCYDTQSRGIYSWTAPRLRRR